MKLWKIWPCIGLCALLMTGLAGCTEDREVPSSSVPESSAVSEISSAPETASSWFVPASDLIPSSPEEGAEGFEADFSQNPIDRQYDEDYGTAVNFSTMRQACDVAAARWREMVDTAYEAAVKYTAEEDRPALQTEQNTWLSEIDGKVKKVQKEAGDDNEGILTSSRQIVLMYRERAMELCRIQYEADGTLPEFPDINE